MARSLMTVYDGILDSPVGRLGIRLRDGELVALDYLAATTPTKQPAAPAARRVQAALTMYFRDPVSLPDLPLRLQGTPFQLRVWERLREVPPGSTIRYGELARLLDSGARAVGNACRANPIPIMVPCHRVVSARGLGGYGGARAGSRLRVKRWLLDHEGPGLEFR